MFNLFTLCQECSGNKEVYAVKSVFGCCGNHVADGACCGHFEYKNIAQKEDCSACEGTGFKFAITANKCTYE